MHKLHLLKVVCAAMAIGTWPAPAPAQSAGGPYRIAPATIAGGGATLSGGAFRLNGTVGQPATSVLGAATFRLYNGFWAPASAASDDSIFANGFDL